MKELTIPLKYKTNNLKLSSAYNTIKIMKGTFNIKTVPIKSKNCTNPICTVNEINHKKRLVSKIVLKQNTL